MRYLTTSYGGEHPSRSKVKKQHAFQRHNKGNWKKDTEFPQELWEALTERHDCPPKAVFGTVAYKGVRVPAWMSKDKSKGKIVFIHPEMLPKE